jgi:hypothetical protein
MDVSGAATLVTMTSDRSKAYRRVVTTLRDMGPATLHPSEQACIREAADMLLFCRDLDREDARTAFAAAATLTERLNEAERWTSWRARRLLDDVWACGPGAIVEAAAA